MLWIRGEPPVLMFACAMQWLQSTLAVFHSNYYGVSLTEYGGPELTQASWLSLAGVLVLAAGIKTALFHRRSAADKVAEQSKRISPGRIFPIYLGAFVLFYFLDRLAFVLPGLHQPLVALSSLRWILLFLLFQAVITQQRNYRLLMASTILEFAVGVLGFFGGFKDVIFLLLVATPLSRANVRGWRLAAAVLFVLLLLCYAVIWTAVKGEYRDFLSEGSGQQEIAQSVEARLLKLPELVSGLNRQTLADGLEQSILRLSYVTFFARSIANVPTILPHENGALWGAALQHVVMPRLLFSDKAAIDDSAQTSYYTGIQVAGVEQGTSISLGYMAESYIDFGEWGMFVPIYFLGIFYGFIYRYFAGSKPEILGLAIATAILIFSAYKVETSSIKVVGGNLMSLIVLGLFAKVAGQPLWRSVTNHSDAPTRR